MLGVFVRGYNIFWQGELKRFLIYDEIEKYQTKRDSVGKIPFKLANPEKLSPIMIKN